MTVKSLLIPSVHVRFRRSSKQPGSSCTTRWATGLALSSWPRRLRSTWTTRKLSGNYYTSFFFENGVSEGKLLNDFPLSSYLKSPSLSVICATGTRSVSTSSTKRAKDSSPLWTCSRFWTWVVRLCIFSVLSFTYTLVFITRYRPALLFYCLRRASTSRLMKIPCMKSLTRWTSTRTDKWKLMNSCRYVTRGQISVWNVKTMW